MSLARVPLFGQPGRSVTVDPEATKGAVFGVNLTYPDGTLVKASDFQSAATPATPGTTIVVWDLIIGVPPNVQALASISTEGLYVITGPGASVTRSIDGDEGSIAVENSDGVDGNPKLYGLNPYAIYMKDPDGNILRDPDGNFLATDSGFPIRADALQPHNSINGLQGGNASERYHLTAAQAASLTPILAGGTTAQFLRGDLSWSDTLQGPLGILTPANIADGIILVNANSVSNPTPAIEAYADNGTTQANISATTYGVNGGGIFHGRMANGTKASPTGITKGQIYAGYGGRPYATGVGFLPSSPVSLHWVASENQTSTGYGGYFRVLTTKTGTTARAEVALATDNGVWWTHDQQFAYDPTDYAQTSFLTGYTGSLVSGHNQTTRSVLVSYGGTPTLNICGTSGTPAAPSSLGAAATMGVVGFTTYAGGAWVAPAIMLARTTEAHSGSAQGTAIAIQIMRNGQTSRTEAISFSGEANTLVNTTSEVHAGRGCIGLGNAITIPSANPVGGVVIYAEAGAAKARGTSGTITTFAPAEPHCPKCKSDFVHEWENNVRGYGYLAVCMSCYADGVNSHTRVKGAWNAAE